MKPQQKAIEFLNSRQSLVLTTIDSQGVTETSVAAMVFVEGAFYIFTSELSQHTKNLLNALNTQHTNVQAPVISGLLLADEADTPQMFARERMSFHFKVSEITQETTDEPLDESSQSLREISYATVLNLFSESFGEVVEVLQSLPDFHLFKLSPKKGTYVVGFGQAFAFEKLPHNGLTAVKN